jgi:hypothetical protein
MEKVSFEQATFKGRVICDQRELGGGYCGSGTFESHCKQLADPESWVQSSKDRWIRAYIKEVSRDRIEEIYKKAEVEIESIISDALITIN